MNKEFKGVYPALITPMDSDGNLNESALRKVIKFNISAGVHGFWVAGGSGESVLLDDFAKHYANMHTLVYSIHAF